MAQSERVATACVESLRSERAAPRAMALACSSVYGEMQRCSVLAELLRRVFAIEVFVCPHCGGTRRLLAAIHGPKAVERELGSLGLSALTLGMAGVLLPPGEAELPESRSRDAWVLGGVAKGALRATGAWRGRNLGRNAPRS